MPSAIPTSCSPAKRRRVIDMPKKKAVVRNPEKDKPKTGLKEKFAEMLELPKEIVLNIPKVTIVGNKDMMIENYKGVMEYEDGRIRVNTGTGVVKVTGARLLIREITSEDIIISGDIHALEFIK
jgi:sporulation protein YqfC